MIRVSGSLDREQLLEEDEEVQLQVTVRKGHRPLCTPALYPLTFDLSSLGAASLTSALRPLLCSQATEVHPNIYGQKAKVSIWVTLRVTDVNDHKPEFYNCSLTVCTPQDNFTGSVDEHASTRIPIDDLTMVVSDPDKAGGRRQGVAWAGWMVGDGWGREVGSDQENAVLWCMVRR